VLNIAFAAVPAVAFAKTQHCTGNENLVGAALDFLGHAVAYIAPVGDHRCIVAVAVAVHGLHVKADDFGSMTA